MTIDKDKVLDLTHLKMSAADCDWIRAARLQAAAEKGDLEAAAKLKKMQDTIVTRISADELLGRIRQSEDDRSQSGPDAQGT